LIVVVALAFRGLIPTGYMPDISRSGGQPFGITICGGTGHHHQKSDDGKQHDMPCPYSVNSVFASRGFIPAIFLPVFIYTALVVVMVAFAFAQTHRHHGNASPRAPPAFS
jgi:hypothetical protein